MALVMPAGMDENARKEWFIAAVGTLRLMPEDLLKMGCHEARKTADHHSKVVPAIIRATSDLWEKRRQDAATAEPFKALAKPVEKEEYVTREQAREILAEFGLLGLSVGRNAAYAEARLPTKDDYRAMGFEGDEHGEG